MSYIQSSDIHILEAFDGKDLVLPSGEYAMISYGDFGAPPVNFITRRGYKQTGDTFLDYTIGRRNITLELNHADCDDRATYWAFRAELHDLLRHNRGGLMTYILIRPGNTKRSLKVLPEPGMSFPPSGDNWEIRESIRFAAFDPIWFDPDAASLTLSGAVGTDLVFPITFPIVFGPSGVNFTTGTLTYPGTWVSYPTFVLTGPYDWVTIQNVQTAVSIGLSVPIGAGETRTIVLTPGEQSVTDQAGMNKFSDLAPNSNLIDFNIRPDPLVAGGQQEITIQMQGGSVGVSGATISYYDRYVAI